MTGTTFIYGLSDPTTGELRYIGKADNHPDKGGTQERWIILQEALEALSKVTK